MRAKEDKGLHSYRKAFAKKSPSFIMNTPNGPKYQLDNDFPIDDNSAERIAETP
jgi:hypothetical protein